MRFFGKFYLLHDRSKILCYVLRGYILTCNNTLHFSYHHSIVYGKPMRTLYICYCNHKLFFIRTQLSWYSYFILFSRDMDHLCNIQYWHIYCLHPLLQVPNFYELKGEEDIPQMTCYDWPRNTVIRFHILIWYIQQQPYTSYGHQIPIYIQLIAMLHRYYIFGPHGELNLFDSFYQRFIFFADCAMLVVFKLGENFVMILKWNL